jgi:hypothetical protein
MPMPKLKNFRLREIAGLGYHLRHQTAARFLFFPGGKLIAI